MAKVCFQQILLIELLIFFPLAVFINCYKHKCRHFQLNLNQSSFSLAAVQICFCCEGMIRLPAKKQKKSSHLTNGFRKKRFSHFDNSSKITRTLFERRKESSQLIKNLRFESQLLEIIEEVSQLLGNVCSKLEKPNLIRT